MLHQIGAGVLGPVFRAYDPENERLVAVKLFRLDLPPDQVHRLEAELSTLASTNLNHPALAQPLRAGRTGVAAYLAEEFVAAESLDIVIRDSGAARFDEVLRLGTHLASALDLAAAAGVLHGTLHPRDVLLSSDAIRLTGIGVAQALERIGQAAPIRRPYSAPELVAGARWERRADVFSLATLMHEMLWAKRVNGIGPQAAESLTEIEGADLDRLRLTFARALAEDPDHRFATALEFIDVLRDATSNRGVAMAAGATAKQAKAAPPDVPESGEAAPGDVPVTRPRSARPGSRAAEVSALLRSGRQDPDAMPLFAAAAPEPAKRPLPPAPALSSSPPGPIAERVEPIAEHVEPIAERLEIDHPLRMTVEAPAGDPASVEVEIDRFADESESPIVVDEEPAPAAPAPFSSIDDHDRFDDYRTDVTAESLEAVEGTANSEHLADTENVVTPENHTNAEKPEKVDHAEPRPAPSIQIRPRGMLNVPEAVAEPEEEESALSRGFMPLVLALIVGLGIGFAAGYGIGSNAGAGQNELAGAIAPTEAAPVAASQPIEPPAPATAPVAPVTSVAPSVDPVSPAEAVVPRVIEPKATAPAPPAREAVPETGRILVRSTPSNARVLLDGREVGRTPYAAREVSRGNHLVRIVRDGYKTEERRVAVTATEPSRTITVELERNAPPARAAAAPAASRTPSAPPPAAPAATTGSLYLDSRPSQATVTIDGKPSGTTPMLLEGLEPGDHTIRIELADHRPVTQSVKIAAGQRTRVNVPLDR